MSEEVLLKAENFTVTYVPTVHKMSTIRDLFVSLFSNPWKLISNSRDRFNVLEKINLTVKKGDIVGILGVNGVGKTTLCRYLSGIIKSNEIKIAGDVRAIFDTNISFYANLTGRENAIMLSEIMFSHLSQSEKKAIVAEALEFSELNEYIDVPINNYSRGMRARLYLSLVTAKEADILVLDEIFGGTDVFFNQKLEERIKNMIHKSGAVILVSHDLEDILKYCNRTIVLSEKKVAFDGTPEEGIAYYTRGL